MNETLRQLYERKSMRAFTDRSITAEEREAILRAAFMAPTPGCQQLYTILEITDQSLKDALAVSCDNQPFIAKAPMMLIFCADCRKWYDAYRDVGCDARTPGAGDLLLAMQDALIAAQNTVTAADSLGLGSCYIGDIMERYEYHRELLHLPDYVFPATLVVYGAPTEAQKKRTKPARAEERWIVHENGYRAFTPEDRRSLFSAYTGGKDYEEWMRAFCARKYSSDFAREMSRSVDVFLEQLMHYGNK